MKNPTATKADIDTFYDLLAMLAERTGGPRTLGACNGRMRWPERGVYFFFEPGEVRRSAAPRVVRVGTHALTETSKATLWKRLSQHQGTLAGANAGGGNHRGSIFRLHVGTALLASDPTLAEDPGSQTWGRGSSAPPEVKAQELRLEQAVSRHIRQMPFLWLAVDDPPGRDSERGLIESSAIALLSNLATADADPASPDWLGHHADRAAIRGSALWNVKHVRDTAHPDFLSTLHHWVAR